MAEPALLSTLTGAADTDRIVLLNLDDENLFHAAQIDRWFVSICNESLWREKILQSLGVHIVTSDYRSTYSAVAKLKNDDQRLVWAADNGYLEVLMHLIKPFALIPDEDGSYFGFDDPHDAERSLQTLQHRVAIEDALRAAAKKGHNDILDFLINRYGDRYLLHTLMRLAIKARKVDTIVYLLKQGAQIDVYHLEKAVKHDSVALFNILYKKFRIFSNPLVNYLLVEPAKRGYINLLKRLLNIGLTWIYSESPVLSGAAQNGQNDVIKLLMSIKGAKSVKDHHAYLLNDALVAASAGGHLFTVKLLQSYGGSLHANKGLALRRAALHNHIDIVRYLIDQKVDPHSENDCAFRNAAKEGNLEIVRFLFDFGADLHAENDEALRLASQNGHLSTVEFLLRQGANLYAFDHYALRWAAMMGHIDVVMLLLSHGANIHASNDEAIRSVTAYGRIEVLKFLLTKGDYPKSLIDELIYKARDKGFVEIEERLREYQRL